MGVGSKLECLIYTFFTGGLGGGGGHRCSNVSCSNEIIVIHIYDL